MPRASPLDVLKRPAVPPILRSDGCSVETFIHAKCLERAKNLRASCLIACPQFLGSAEHCQIVVFGSWNNPPAVLCGTEPMFPIRVHSDTFEILTWQCKQPWKWRRSTVSLVLGVDPADAQDRRRRCVGKTRTRIGGRHVDSRRNLAHEKLRCQMPACSAKPSFERWRVQYRQDWPAHLIFDLLHRRAPFDMGRFGSLVFDRLLFLCSKRWIT